MTWANVQNSPVATTNATTVTPTFAGGTTTRNLLVCCIEYSIAATWTLPAGWVQGPNVNNGGVALATLFYYINNPGGITSVLCTSSVAGNNKTTLGEFSSSGTVTLNATGTGTAGAVNTCTATTSSGTPAAGDLGICVFEEHLPTASAPTWTNPSGWSLIGAYTGSSGNVIYAAYLPSAASGALSVAALSSVTSTSANGWAGLVATFTAASGTNASAGLAASSGTSLGEDDSTLASAVTLNMTIQGA